MTHPQPGYILWRTVYGIVNRLDWKVSNPRALSDNVKYCAGGVIGIWKDKPRM
jgi:hypothetical protein